MIFFSVKKSEFLFFNISFLCCIVWACLRALYCAPRFALQGLQAGTRLLAVSSPPLSCSIKWSHSVAVAPHQWHRAPGTRICARSFGGRLRLVGIRTRPLPRPCGLALLCLCLCCVSLPESPVFVCYALQISNVSKPRARTSPPSGCLSPTPIACNHCLTAALDVSHCPFQCTVNYPRSRVLTSRVQIPTWPGEFHLVVMRYS